MNSLKTPALVLVSTLIACPSIGRAENELASILEITGCGSDKVTKATNGDLRMNLDKVDGREAFCSSLLKVSIPKGYRLQSGLKASLTAAGNLAETGDKVYVLLRVRSADLTDKVLKGASLISETPSPTQLTVKGDVTLPEIGSCDKDREALLSFTNTAKVIKAGDSDISVALLTLEIPALDLTQLSCLPLPPTDPT